MPAPRPPRTAVRNLLAALVMALAAAAVPVAAVSFLTACKSSGRH
jgi:hypothetical protein